MLSRLPTLAALRRRRWRRRRRRRSRACAGGRDHAAVRARLRRWRRRRRRRRGRRRRRSGFRMSAADQDTQTEETGESVRMIVVPRVAALGLHVEHVGDVLLDAATQDIAASVVLGIIIARRRGAADIIPTTG